MSPFPSKQWGEEPQESTSWGWEQREHGPRAGGSSGPQEGPAGGGGRSENREHMGSWSWRGKMGRSWGGMPNKREVGRCVGAEVSRGKSHGIQNLFSNFHHGKNKVTKLKTIA